MNPAISNHAAFDTQAQRQAATYWRMRRREVLDHLEKEVRRMLQLEQSLDRFATDYVERLSGLRQALAPHAARLQSIVVLPEAPFQWAERHVGLQRQAELKRRYRQLARELHPDFAGVDNAQPSMQQINDAYRSRDLALLVRLEAQSLAPEMDQPTPLIEAYLQQVEQAAHTYRQAYAQLLNIPLYGLYARAASAQEDGWDYLAGLARRARQALADIADSHAA